MLGVELPRLPHLLDALDGAHEGADHGGGRGEGGQSAAKAVHQLLHLALRGLGHEVLEHAHDLRAQHALRARAAVVARGGEAAEAAALAAGGRAEEHPSVEHEVEADRLGLHAGDLLQHRPDGRGPLAEGQRPQTVLHNVHERIHETLRQAALVALRELPQAALEVLNGLRVQVGQHRGQAARPAISALARPRLGVLREWIQHRCLELVQGALCNAELDVEDQRQHVLHPDLADARLGASPEQECKARDARLAHEDGLVRGEARQDVHVEVSGELVCLEAERLPEDDHH
mmetsp:Transcript_13317/g.42101  ORF Transcript_13317/g.42101 Transcript_13317/m.42101 type:complete len:289 (+) Transcript_13317:1741-2607(+)